MVLLTLTGLAAWQLFSSPTPDRAFAAVPLLLLGMALGIGLGVDLVRLDGDIGRMNTMFKYYLEAWVLFSLVAAYLLWRLGEDGWLRRWNWGKAAILAREPLSKILACFVRRAWRNSASDERYYPWQLSYLGLGALAAYFGLPM